MSCTLHDHSTMWWGLEASFLPHRTWCTTLWVPLYCTAQHSTVAKFQCACASSNPTAQHTCPHNHSPSTAECSAQQPPPSCFYELPHTAAAAAAATSTTSASGQYPVRLLTQPFPGLSFLWYPRSTSHSTTSCMSLS